MLTVTGHSNGGKRHYSYDEIACEYFIIIDEDADAAALPIGQEDIEVCVLSDEASHFLACDEGMQHRLGHGWALDGIKVQQLGHQVPAYEVKYEKRSPKRKRKVKLQT